MLVKLTYEKRIDGKLRYYERRYVDVFNKQLAINTIMENATTSAIKDKIDIFQFNDTIFAQLLLSRAYTFAKLEILVKDEEIIHDRSKLINYINKNKKYLELIDMSLDNNFDIFNNYLDKKLIVNLHSISLLSFDNLSTKDMNLMMFAKSLYEKIIKSIDQL